MSFFYFFLLEYIVKWLHLQLINLFVLTDLKKQPILLKISQFSINDDNILSLSVDWNVLNHNVRICVSDSAGCVSVILINESFELTLLHKLKVHDYEAWVATFLCGDSSVLLTGENYNKHYFRYYLFLRKYLKNFCDFQVLSLIY